jgi:hypothetical protein
MKVAYDCQLKRPACVLIAAAMGADSNLANHFDTEDWLLAPTPGMGVYECTQDQLEQLVEMTAARNT